MNRQAVFHAPDSPCCCPVSERALSLRLRAARGEIQRVEVIYENKYVFHERRRRARMRLSCQTELYDWFTVTLEAEDTRFAYIFRLYGQEGAWYFSEDGVTDTYDYKKGYYNFFQYPYINRSDVQRPVSWMEHAVFYQIFVDRFRQGHGEADKSYVNLPWGNIPDPRSLAGGDLDGVREKLDYLAGLGVNAIYLTPIFYAPSNHKYDTWDFYTVDPRFGGNDALRRLVEAAHGRGMRIVLDGVFNHVGEGFAPFRDVKAKGRDSEYFDWFIIRGGFPQKEPLNYDVFASCAYMPKLDTSNPKVREYLCRVGASYVADYGIDGWRLDVADEVSRDFWRDFRRAVKGANPEAVLIAENWHDASASLRGDQFDGIMNYSVTKACLDYFAWGKLDGQHMAWKLSELLMRNSDPVNAMMLNLLDSHDTYRFLTEARGDREALHAALSLIFMLPGAPCVFYGTEKYIMGGFDPDCRRCMDWSDGPSAAPLLRKLSRIPRTGRLEIESADGMLILRRGRYTLYLNRTKKEARAGAVTVPAMSHRLLKGEKDL